MKKITVMVTEDGDISVDMDGFHGESCAEELKRLIAALDKQGVKVIARSERRKAGACILNRQGISN